MRAVLLSVALAGCCWKHGTTPTPATTGSTKPDVHSAAAPRAVAVSHVSLDLDVDFDHRTLAGTARLTLDRRDPAAAEVILDTEALTIEAVTACDAPTAIPFTLGGPVPILGRALHVSLDAKRTCVAVRYHTGPDASALLWVDPAGTAGKQHPMLFTQSEAIHARSWIPLQDSPGVRFTYDATIRTPAALRPVMSADNPSAIGPDGAWHFDMPQPIPAYLMALAVGDFVFRPIGPTTGVYAEPSVADGAAWEFAEVDQMVAAAEALYGPYRWGRYDMLVLPPSFPFGGMENPKLTFLTPTVITGDRALVSLIAHELAHSWSGNLVTNATWSDSWLNEGITTYVERRIIEQLRGPELAEVEWYLSAKDLAERVQESGADDPDSPLAANLTITDDPESRGGYIYDKGSWFLRTLERSFGRPTFDAFLKGWFEHHAFQPEDTATFEAEATAALYAHPPADAPDLHHWLYGTGVDAAVLSSPPPPRAAAVEAQAHAFAATGAHVDATHWTTLDWVVFLRALPDAVPLDRIAALDAYAHLTETKNREIATYWLPLLVRSNAHDAEPAVEAFLLAVGRGRMVRPLYHSLMKGDDAWRALARSVFTRAAPMYHPIVRDMVAKQISQQ